LVAAVLEPITEVRVLQQQVKILYLIPHLLVHLQVVLLLQVADEAH
jgi:hypothetical protein